MKLSIALTIWIFSWCFYKLKAENLCGENWVAFRDEKCFKILDDTFRTFAEAEKSCASLENEPTLPIIHIKEEQEFLADYLFKTQKKVENFWIGAKFSGGKFHWVDNSELSYTNWEKKELSNKENYCVQFEADDSRRGKWIEEPCETKKNLVVCQKMQTWSLTRLQRTFLDSRKQLVDNLDAANNKIANQKHELDETKKNLEEANKNIVTQKQSFDSLKQNIFPIGFIYAQLPSEKSPVEIWPSMQWTDVSATYAGVFFRVNGGDAAAFGQVQQDNAPRLNEVIVVDDNAAETGKSARNFNMSISIPITGWSDAIYTGANSGVNCWSKYRLSTGEVRPRNMAIRIWKRIN